MSLHSHIIQLCEYHKIRHIERFNRGITMLYDESQRTQVHPTNRSHSHLIFFAGEMMSRWRYPGRWWTGGGSCEGVPPTQPAPPCNTPLPVTLERLPPSSLQPLPHSIASYLAHQTYSKSLPPTRLYQHISYQQFHNPRLPPCALPCQPSICHQPHLPTLLSSCMILPHVTIHIFPLAFPLA